MRFIREWLLRKYLSLSYPLTKKYYDQHFHKFQKSQDFGKKLEQLKTQKTLSHHEKIKAILRGELE